MATTYHIELRLNQPDMLLFLEHARMFKPSVTAIPEEPTTADATESPQPELSAVYKPKRSLRAPRAKRGSKVIDTILGFMQSGNPVNVGMLKHALKDAGMSPSSLSTGLAILQKKGTIQRDGHGMYFLTAYEGVAA